MHIEIAVPDYSAAKHDYAGLSLRMKTSSGSVDTPGRLFLHQSSIGSITMYSGFFRPANADQTAVELAGFSLAVSEGITADTITMVPGGGVGSITYTFGTNPVQTQDVSVSSTSFFDNGIIYGVQMTIIWYDPTEANCYFWMQVYPFTGTGTFTAAVVLGTDVATPGNWSNGATLNAIYSETANKSLWQGSLVANNLPWQDGPHQPNVSLDVSALTLTIQHP